MGGSVIFALSYRKVVQTNARHELEQSLEIERIKLEASVNAEIAIALKMADSPIIQAYFSNPSDSALEQMAFLEIAGYRRAFMSNTVFWVNDIDHRFYSGDRFSHIIDTADPNNYWYLMTLNETEKYNFNINYNPDLDVTSLWINAPVFDARRRPIGILGTGVELSSFIDSLYRSYKGSAALYFFNADGEVTGARDSTLVANKETMRHYLGSKGEGILSKAKSLKPGEFQSFEEHGDVIAVGGVPALNWYITGIQPIGMGDVLGSSMTGLFLAMMAVIAGIFGVFYVFVAQLLKPMNYMVQTLDHISVDWDLTKRLQLSRKDEIGTLGDFFNLTFEKIKNLLLGIKVKTAALSETGDELASYMIKTRTDVDGISSHIQGMRSQVLSQSDKVNSTAGSMELIMTGITDLNDHISIQAESVSRSSSAIEEMIANVQSVTQTLVRNSENINSLAESSAASRTDLMKVSSDIKEIAQESESLLEINSVMQTIASQTNLLSMNAAIEAAHAGESGRGFAVVADEIRKLAENSGKQSKTISAVLKKIKLMIDAITKSTVVVMERFENMEHEVTIVSDQETAIRNAMEEQGVGSRQILEAITQLNSVTEKVRQSSSSMAAESKEVLNQSGDLKRITAEVAENMDAMTGNAEDISNTVTRVQEITEENKENIGALSQEIARFKVE